MSLKEAFGFSEPTPLEAYVENPDDPTAIARLVEEEPRDRLQRFTDNLAVVNEMNQVYDDVQRDGHDLARETLEYDQDMGQRKRADRNRRLQNAWFGLGSTAADTAYGTGDFGRNVWFGLGGTAADTVHGIDDFRERRADGSDTPTYS